MGNNRLPTKAASTLKKEIGMTNKQINVLNQISGVESDTPQANTEDIMGDYWVNRSEEIVKKTEGMDPVERALTWERETGDWSGWNSNKEYYWNTKYKLSPETDEMAKNTHISGEVDKLLAMSPEKKEHYFRDNAYKLPNHLFKHLEPLYNINDATLNNKELERARIGQGIEFSNLLQGKESDLEKLSPDVSTETHAESIRLAYMNGYTNMTIDQFGFVVVPVNGDPVRAIDLDDSLDITDTIISKVDLTPIALKAASKGVNEARKSQLFSEREVIRALRTKLNDVSIKEEHKKSISIDHAFNVSNNPIEDLKTDIVTVIGSSLKNNKYKSTTELINATYLYHKDILNTVKERM
jgi:hypothetical protein